MAKKSFIEYLLAPDGDMAALDEALALRLSNVIADVWDGEWDEDTAFERGAVVSYELALWVLNDEDSAAGVVPAGPAWRKLIDFNDAQEDIEQEVAALVAAAEAAQVAAEAAAAVAVAAALRSPVESRAWAIANFAPITAPEFIQTAGFAAPGDGGGALYKKVVAEPSYSGKLSITLADAVTVVWYELALQEPISLLMFGGVADNATDNAAAFAGAIASPFPRIYLNEGRFYTATGLLGLGNKRFYGPGSIRTLGGEYAPGNYSYMGVPVTPASSGGQPGLWDGDNSMVEPRYIILGEDIGQSLDQRYFEPTTTPEWVWMSVYGGSSGHVCRLTGITVIGTAQVAVDFTEGIEAGDEVAFVDAAGVYLERKFVAYTTTYTIAFTSNMVGAHPVGTRVIKAARTNNALRHTEYLAAGPGDHYIEHVRLYPGHTPLPGQTHFFETQTVGIDGGDASAGVDGCYMQSREMAFFDQGFDVAVISEVRSFHRTNDTGARGVVWLGSLHKSEGSEPLNADHVVVGKFLGGLDYGMADFGAGQAAVKLANSHRIYWGVSQTPDVGGFTLWSSILSTCYVTGTGGATPEWKVMLNGVPEFVVQAGIAYAAKFAATTEFTVAGVKVVGARQGAIADHPSDGYVNAILTALRAHGLIAT